MAISVSVALPYIGVSGGQFTDDSVRLEADGYNWRRKWVVNKRGLGFDTKRDKWGAADIRIAEYTPDRIKLTPDACLEWRRHDWARLTIDGQRMWLRTDSIGGAVMPTSDALALRRKGGR